MRWSEKETYNQCPYKYKLTYIDKLQKIEQLETSQHHLRWGQAIDEGLTRHFLGKPWSDIETGFLEYYPKNLDEKDEAKTVEHGLQALKNYIQFYKAEDEKWDMVAIHPEGFVEEHDSILHPDAIRKLRITGEIYGWDYKTTGKDTTGNYWKNFEISDQVSRYSSWIEKEYGQCSGFYIDSLSVKFLKRKNKYGDGPGFLSNFQRQVFNRSKDQIAYAWNSDSDWTTLKKFSIENNVWPKSLSSRCPWCEFYELCLSSSDEQIKEILYQTKKETVTHESV